MRGTRCMAVGVLLLVVAGCGGSAPTATTAASLTPKASATPMPTPKPTPSLAALRTAYTNLAKPVAVATCRQNQTIAKGTDLPTGRSVAAQFAKALHSFWTGLKKIAWPLDASADVADLVRAAAEEETAWAIASKASSIAAFGDDMNSVYALIDKRVSAAGIVKEDIGMSSTLMFPCTS